jgi:hypothetical protein
MPEWPDRLDRAQGQRLRSERFGANGRIHNEFSPQGKPSMGKGQNIKPKSTTGRQGGPESGHRGDYIVGQYDDKTMSKVD